MDREIVAARVAELREQNSVPPLTSEQVERLAVVLDRFDLAVAADKPA